MIGIKSKLPIRREGIKPMTKLKISGNKGVTINEDMIGLFFEDINYGADGGLYAEMIENRSFEFLDARGTNNKYYQTYDGGYGWNPYPVNSGNAVMEYKTSNPLNTINPHYLEFTAVSGQMGFTNKAYDGICLEEGKNYKISFYAKCVDYKGNITVSIRNKETGELFTQTNLAGIKDIEWKQYHAILKADQTVKNALFVMELSEIGTVDFDFISMIPEEAVKGVFRKDLLQLLADLKPGFLRFPGGCIIEGNELSNRYQWKKSVGPAEERKANWNRWAVHQNSEKNQYTSIYSHYNQTLGLGYFEYFLLCECIGAKAIPVMNVGLACQYQSDELVAIDSKEFPEYVQDAMDLIEFANGDTDTKWGNLRAAMGHPESFGLEMIGIGNEQWQTEKVDFFERYVIFEQTIHEKYPEMKLIGSAGPDVNTERYDKAWNFYNEKIKVNPNFTYAVDEHYYMKPEWFFANDHFYDNFSREIKVFSGEYAAHPSDGMNNPEANNWNGALSEAAFLTGLERNADVVALASYAPLFARIGYAQWSPDMIWFDGDTSYGTPSYYVQKMYGNNMGSHTLLSDIQTNETGIYQVVSYDEAKEEIIIKIANANAHVVQTNIVIDEIFKVNSIGKLTKLTANNLEDSNSITNPQKVMPKEEMLEVVGNKFELELTPISFCILRVKSIKA